MLHCFKKDTMSQHFSLSTSLLTSCLYKHGKFMFMGLVGGKLYFYIPLCGTLA